MSNTNYTITSKTRNITFGLMALGVIALVVGFLTDHAPEGVDEEKYHHARVWANLLVNGYFYLGIGLLATFFMALQYVAEVAWSVAVKRVYEAVSAYLPVGSIIMFIILLAGQFHAHHLYHWMNPAVYDKSSPEFDEVITGKAGYFAPWFFWLRTILYLVVWYFFTF
jgi:hypothetical protein